MPTVEVIIDLPFFLRLEGSFTVQYKEVCQESQLPELMGQDVQMMFERRPAGSIDKSDWPKERSTVAVRVETPTQLSNDSVNTFAIRNCLEILNKVILSYYSTTGEVSNAGFITPLGTSYMQLFAEIRVDGKDFRDRWPSQSINTFPLQRDQIEKFTAFLTGKEEWPARLFLTSAILSLEQGQYSLAVLQAATSVELRITQVIRKKLAAAGWSNKAIKPYKRKTLGAKLDIPKTDPRSLETHYGQVPEFPKLYQRLKEDLNKPRNHLIHNGHLASHEHAKKAVEVARDFLKIVN